MLTSPVLSHVVLAITGGLLLYVALADLIQYKIRNDAVLVLAGLFVLHAVVAGRWPAMHWNALFALLMFLIMLLFYTRNMIGGGDLKLLTVCFLWTGIECALPFSILLVVFGGSHALIAHLGWVSSQAAKGRQRIAFAPTAAAALLVIFMAGCLQPQ
jgi:prepilin peptidase CpaA